jgi:hypothetical protein
MWTEITDTLVIPPLSLKDMRSDPILGQWSLVKRGFQGLTRHQVSDEIWQRIKQVIAAKDPEAGRLLTEFTHAAEGVRAIKGLGEGLSEKEFEELLAIPLLKSLGWDLGRTVRPQYEMAIKVGSGRPHCVRADFVGFRDALSSEALLVIESKRCIRSDEELRIAVEQCESYAGKLRCHRFAVAAPEGIWVYTFNFPGQSAQLAYMEFQGDISPAMVEKLKPLIGFNTLRS